MSSYFSVTLDTTPPQITWGSPSSTQADTTLVISYAVNEPAIQWVRLRDSNSILTAGIFDANNITVNIPADAAMGNAWIEAQVEDDLGNQTLRQYQFTITPLGYVQPTGVSVGKPFTYGAGAPAFLKDNIVFEGGVSLLRLKRFTYTGSLGLRRRRTKNFTGTIDFQRLYSVQLECKRDKAEHYLNLCREDEELLLLI